MRAFFLGSLKGWVLECLVSARFVGPGLLATDRVYRVEFEGLGLLKGCWGASIGGLWRV